jgi:hypothetical protein
VTITCSATLALGSLTGTQRRPLLWLRISQTGSNDKCRIKWVSGQVKGSADWRCLKPGPTRHICQALKK